MKTPALLDNKDSSNTRDKKSYYNKCVLEVTIIAVNTLIHGRARTIILRRKTRSLKLLVMKYR